MGPAGAGKTYGKTAPEELSPEYLQSNSLTVEQMTIDGIGLSEYLVKHLGKQKIILFGTSLGSVLGAGKAIKRPDLFYAYIGHSQVVNPLGDFSKVYRKVFQMAQKVNDQKSVDALNLIGKPPYEMARNVGQLLRVVKKYERENSIPAPDGWFVLSPAYDNGKDAQHRSDGDDYSFVNYVGDKRLGVKSMVAGINLMKDGLDFKIPIYLIQGQEDLLTSPETTREYFDKIKAQKKEYILLPETAHGFNQSVIETQCKIIKEYILPFIK